MRRTRWGAPRRPDRPRSLEGDLLELAREFDRRKDGGPIAIESDYLVVIATRAG